jgi:hypothetical protein
LLWDLVKFADSSVIARASDVFLETVDRFGLSAVVRTRPTIEEAIALMQASLAASQTLMEQSQGLAASTRERRDTSRRLIKRSLEQGKIFIGYPR